MPHAGCHVAPLKIDDWKFGTMRKYLFPLFLAGVGILPAQAELADRDKPMFIEADTMRYDDANKVTNATGRVVATKGTLVLRADAVEVRQDDTGKSFVVATSRAGNQALMRQKREGLNEFFEAQANRIERDEKTQIARLLGKAVMRRLVGDTQVDEVRGDTIVYNEATEVYNVSGGAQTVAGPDGIPPGRVRAILGPRSTTGAAAAQGAAASAAKRQPVPLQPSTQIGTGAGR